MVSLDVLNQSRDALIRFAKDISEDEWLAVPPGRRNNMAWNLGHIVTVQQMLANGLSRKPFHVPKEYVPMYKQGSSPEDWTSSPDIARLLDDAVRLPEITRKEYADGVFESFEPYTTSTGFSLGSIEESITFNNFHEGVHMGMMMAIKLQLRGA